MRTTLSVMFCKIFRLLGGKHKWILVRKMQSADDAIQGGFVDKGSTVRALTIVGPGWQRTGDTRSADGMVCIRCDAVTFWDELSFEDYLVWKGNEGL